MLVSQHPAFPLHIQNKIAKKKTHLETNEIVSKKKEKTTSPFLVCLVIESRKQIVLQKNQQKRVTVKQRQIKKIYAVKNKRHSIMKQTRVYKKKKRSNKKDSFFFLVSLVKQKKRKYLTDKQKKEEYL